ncbi:transposase [Mangrovibacterium lignilyticum]|uniref:transposase n=1 Tax=Mangrovibacterium lignilyticum TaxID=2668052 RepID=UPI0013CFF861|nr:transposase [Mangrovibacterium lignilyticum]
MKKVRFAESQIAKFLKEFESGIDAQVLCREYGLSKATFYNCRKKYAGMDSSQLKRLKESEEENRKLKQIV